MQKTAELSGPALDWAVARAEGFEPRQLWVYDEPSLWKGKECRYSPSTDWMQGGTIIERERISLAAFRGYWEAACCDVCALADHALVAAMRCYVAMKLGDSLDVPPELLK